VCKGTPKKNELTLDLYEIEDHFNARPRKGDEKIIILLKLYSMLIIAISSQERSRAKVCDQH
jgi:hypothetical protein